MSGKGSTGRAWRRGFLAATIGLCLVSATPLFLSGCGSSSGGHTSVTAGGGNVGSSRTAKLTGTYEAKQTLANGKIQDTTLDFVPGTAFETLTGNYTVRILSPRSGGGSDLVSFASGALTANILANGNLHVVLTPDSASRSRASGTTTRQAAGSTDHEFTISSSGSVLQDVIDNVEYSLISQIVQSFQANSIAGNWTGGPAAGGGGFELLDPRDGSQIGALLPMSIQYTATDNLDRKYTAAMTLTDPTSGKSYTATDVQAQLYSHYDSAAGTFPKNLVGVTTLSGDELFVSGSGTLPTTAGSIPIPNTPFTIPLAGHAFVFEAGVIKGTGGKLQLGGLWLKFDKTDPLYALLLNFVQANPTATEGYILAGYFLIEQGGGVSPSPTPTPTPTPGGGQPAVGSVLFSNVSDTNANTTNITKTVASAGFQGNILTATLTEANGTSTVERDLNMQLFAPDDASLSVGKTFAIVNTTNPTAGQARVTYIESAGFQKFWDANGGTVVVVAHDSKTTTLRVINATMTPTENAGVPVQPTGTFTINAAGKF